jgi:hypothetical protein
LTASRIKIAVKIVMITPATIRPRAVLLKFVAKNRIAPTPRITRPKGIPKDTGTVKLLQAD